MWIAAVLNRIQSDRICKPHGIKRIVWQLFFDSQLQGQMRTLSFHGQIIVGNGFQLELS